MARERDYAAEYASRIARGRAAGLTRQEARGAHPREAAFREGRAAGATTWRSIAEAARGARATTIIGRPGVQGLGYLVIVTRGGERRQVLLPPGVKPGRIAKLLRREGEPEPIVIGTP